MCAVRSLTRALMRGDTDAAAPHIPALLAPTLAAAASPLMPDLCNLAKGCSVMMAQAPLSADLLAELIRRLRELGASPSWHLRGCTLPPIQLIAYRSQFATPASDHRSAVRELLLSLLADARQEVREAAVPIYSGFIRIHGEAERRRAFEWAMDRLKRGKGVNGRGVVPNGDAATRHGGVLALAALVMLAPYDVPHWLPQVLDVLAGYSNEPQARCRCCCAPTGRVPDLPPSDRAQPIKAAVTKAFADFRRTHTDNWVAHRERFTPEQQEILSDMVVVPSFYA